MRPILDEENHLKIIHIKRPVFTPGPDVVVDQQETRMPYKGTYQYAMTT